MFWCQYLHPYPNHSSAGMGGLRPENDLLYICFGSGKHDDMWALCTKSFRIYQIYQNATDGRDLICPSGTDQRAGFISRYRFGHMRIPIYEATIILKFLKIIPMNLSRHFAAALLLFMAMVSCVKPKNIQTYITEYEIFQDSLSSMMKADWSMETDSIRILKKNIYYRIITG